MDLLCQMIQRENDPARTPLRSPITIAAVGPAGERCAGSSTVGADAPVVIRMAAAADTPAPTEIRFGPNLPIRAM